MFVQGLVWTREPDGILLEEHQALQVNLLDADVGCDSDEFRQFGERLFEARQPGGNARRFVPLANLQRAKVAHIPQDTVEIILAAHDAVGGRIGCVEGHAQFVQPGRDHRAPAPFGKQGAVRVEKHVHTAVFEIPNHLRQILHQHRLADAVQNGALQAGELVDDRSEQLPAHIRRRFEFLVGSGASGAQQIAAIRRLEI